MIRMRSDISALFSGALYQISCTDMSADLSADMIHVLTLRDFKNTAKNQSTP